MNGDDEIKLSRDEYEFRIHMIQFSERTDVSLEYLKESTSEQWHEINELKRVPRKMIAVAATVAIACTGIVIAIVAVIKGG